MIKFLRFISSVFLNGGVLLIQCDVIVSRELLIQEQETGELLW